MLLRAVRASRFSSRRGVLIRWNSVGKEVKVLWALGEVVVEVEVEVEEGR